MMIKIDSHQHFWYYNRKEHSWITDEMKVIQADFLPGDLFPLLKNNGISGCVAVQVAQTDDETDFLLSLAAKNDFIKAVVGWVDLRDDNIQKQLEQRSGHKKLAGFRHIVQAEEPGFLLNKKFVRGIKALAKHGFTYDILIKHYQLPEAIGFIEKNDEQFFVIDHLAKPGIAGGEFAEWKKNISRLGKHQQVYCKISGLVTEAKWNSWKEDDFKRYLDTAVEVFGIRRLIFGSDWPVCLVAATYRQAMSIAQNYFVQFSYEEQAMFWGGNVKRFYGIDDD